VSKNIIITGGAGFIGYHLAKNLSSKKYKVYILDNLSRGKIDFDFKNLLKLNNIKFIKTDLRKKIKMSISNPRYVFHLAGSVGVKNISRNPYESFMNNIITLKNVLDFCKKFKRTKIILFSTSEVYSPLIKKKQVKFPIKENNEIILQNNNISRDSYYISKAFNEKLTQFSKLRHLILRPHNIFGPRMGYSHVIPELTKKIFLKKNLKNSKTIIFSPNHKRAFCYIEDAVNQIIKLSFNNSLKNTTFNIGNMREEIRMIDLAKTLKEKIKSKTKLIKGTVTEGSPSRRVPDMSKTFKATKKLRLTKLSEGLDKTIKWYLEDIKKNE
jgi:UDP-glucose 4-epimerase